MFPAKALASAAQTQNEKNVVGRFLDCVRWDLQQAPNPNLEGVCNHYFSAGGDTENVRVTTAHGRLYFPLKELDEIISKLLNPATITMQALSKQGIKCEDFKPSVRLRAQEAQPVECRVVHTVHQDSCT